MNIHEADMSVLARALRAGTLSVPALMEACQAAWDCSEPRLNAYKTWNGENAVQTAYQVEQLLRQGYDLGPLMGMPVSVKDMFAVPGLPTFAGSVADLGPDWQQPGPLMQAVLGQLALITGKTHTVEFALGGIGVNAHWGTPRNPWSGDEHRVPGGSSSGAGVSLCQGSALLAFGTDTAGSVRIPAALTGTVGLKPTVGRWPTAQVVPLSTSLDTPGILTRSVADSAYAYAAVQSRLQQTPVEIVALPDCRGLRIGVVDNFFWEGASDDVVEVVRSAMGRLEQAGAILIPLQVPGCDELFALFQQGGLSVAELAAYLSTHLPERLEMLDPVVRNRIEDGGAVSAKEYLQRKQYLEQAAQRAAELFRQVDFWLHPTVPITAPTVAELQELDVYRHYNMLALRNPAMANLMGLCALSIPAGVDRCGLPVGVQLTAAAGAEEFLLAAGQPVEQALGRLFRVFN